MVNISQPPLAPDVFVPDAAKVAEISARQLYTAGMTHLGQSPNPQLVSEGIAAGATTDLAQSFTDPQLAPYAQSQPQGLGKAPAGPHNGPGQPGSTLDHFNWDTYWKQMHSYLQDNQAWQKFGEIPQFNFGYIQGVQNAGPDAGKKWQSMLQDRGFLAQNHSVDGSWDADTKTAMQGFYASMALPVALYGKDPAAKNQASLFLQRYTGINATDLANQKRNDPQFQSQVVEGWTMTQGPDRQRDAIHDFVDQFGSENVPQVIQDIANPGTGEEVQQTAWSMASGLLGLPSMLAAKVSGKEDFIGDWFKANSPDAIQVEQRIQPQLTEADKQMLDPALKQLSASQGFSPFNWYTQHINNVVLSGVYTFEDLAHGKATNPFDSLDQSSELGKRVTAHHDDLMGGLFGDQWVKDHPTAGMFGNLIAGIADDPLSWMGGEGVAAGEAGGLALAGESTAAKAANLAKQTTGVASRLTILPVKAAVAGAKLLAHPRTMADAASPALKKLAEETWAPRAATQRAAVDGILKVVPDGNEGTVAELLGVANGAYRAEPEIKKAIDEIMQGADANRIRALMNSTFSHKWQGTHNTFNRIAAQESLLPDLMRKKSEGFLGALRANGSFRASGVEFGFDDANIYQSARDIQERLAILGARETKSMGKTLDKESGKMVPHEIPGIHDIMGQFWKAEDKNIWFDEQLPHIYDTILKGAAKDGEEPLTVAKIRELEQSHNRGRNFAGFKNKGLHSALGGGVERPTYLLTPKGDVFNAKEESVYFAQGGHLVDAMGEISASLDDLISKSIRSVQSKNPKMTPEAAEAEAMKTYATEIDYEKGRLAELQKRVDDMRPGPAMTGQQANKAVAPFTAYGAVVAMHPHLSRLEDVQSALRLDAVTSAWKGLALMRPATSARMLFADDTMRTAAHLADNGAPIHGVMAAVGGTLKGLAAPLALMARGAENKLGRVAANKGVAKFGAVKDETGAVTYTDKAVKYLAAADEIVRDKLGGLNTLKLFRDSDGGNWVAMAPHMPGYTQGLIDTTKVMHNSPEIMAWAKAEAKYKGSGLKALQQAYKDKVGGTAEIIKKYEADVADYADKMNQYMLDFVREPGLLDMLASGKVDEAAVMKMVKNNNIAKRLPNVGARNSTAMAANSVVDAMAQGPGKLFHAISTPMISAARADNFMRLRVDYFNRIKKAHPEWAGQEDMMQRLADGDAAQWMQNSLYQGQRTIAGQVARNVFPFGGATTNMARFWMTEAKAHPWMWDPGTRALLGAEASGSAPSTNKTTGIGENVLSALGFSGSDGLNVDFSHATFLSSDGIASFVPGFGPIFAPLAAQADKNQLVHDVLREIPGLRDQMDTVDKGTTLIPSFIGTDVNALSEATTGRSIEGPLGLGVNSDQNDQAIDNKYKQLLTDYQNGKMDHAPTRDDAVKSLGRDQLAGGVLGAVAPINPTITDQRKAAITTATSQMRSATNPAAQAKVLADNPDVAPYLKYIDRNTTLAEKDALANDPATSWVVTYAQSNTETDDPSVAKPSNLTDYDTALSLGNLKVLGVDGLSAKITKSRNYSAGWAKYQTDVVDVENNFLAQNGVTKTSKAYRDFSKQVIEPVLQGIADNNPDWYGQFVASRSQPKDILGMELKTQPLRSLQTWEVIPQSAALETPKTQMWRQALVYRDWAAGKINQISSSHGSTADKDAIMKVLQADLAGLEKQNPQFGDELKLYEFNKWQDVVNEQVQAKNGY
jgi:hypothetical protein